MTGQGRPRHVLTGGLFLATTSQPGWGNMRCSKCGSDNREGRKFCAACGGPLIVTCAKCGATNQPGESFCGECGAALGDVAPAAGADTTPVTASAGGERRHLTVLFCDLVGSTEIAARLDPEEWR